MSYFSVVDGSLHHTMLPPDDAARLADGPVFLLPPLIGAAHAAFKAWGDAGWSPGPLTPAHVWLTPGGTLAVEFRGTARPAPILHVGVAPDLAAWLVMLCQSMEVFVVIARARAVWTPEELAGALTFMTPAYLPPALVRPAGAAGDTALWATVASALAQAVADGPLAGAHQDRHWQQADETSLGTTSG